MIDIITPGGRPLTVTGEKFARVLSMAGTHGSSPEQRKRARIGNHVRVGSAFGWIPVVITAASTDGRKTWYALVKNTVPEGRAWSLAGYVD